MEFRHILGIKVLGNGCLQANDVGFVLQGYLSEIEHVSPEVTMLSGIHLDTKQVVVWHPGLQSPTEFASLHAGLLVYELFWYAVHHVSTVSPEDFFQIVARQPRTLR